MNWITEHWQDLLAITGALFVLLRLIVALTPTPKDDQLLAKAETWYEKLLGFAALLFGLDTTQGIKKSSGSSGAKLPLIGFILLPFVLGGCLGVKPSPAIQAANDLKRKAITNYAANIDRVLDVLLESYRKEAYSHVDTKVRIDMKTAETNAQATGGKVDLGQALLFFEKLNQQREQKRAEVDQAISAIRRVMAGAQVDLALHLNLDEVVQRYSDAGVDLSAAQSAIDQILELIRQSKNGGE